MQSCKNDLKHKAEERIITWIPRMSINVEMEEEVKNDFAEETEKKKQNTKEALPFRKLLSYADAVDWTLMALATIGSIIHGAALPVGYLLLGKALDAYRNNTNDHDAMVTALKKIVPYVFYMAFATFPAGIVEIGCWMYTGERQLARLRLAFLRATLSQDIAAFDTDLTSGKVITGMSYHMSTIQDAIGEKLGHFVASFTAFFVGVLIAIISCWQVALLTLVIAPMILLIGATYTNKMNAISAVKLIYISEATSMVEQTISQIKMVLAFVGEYSAIKSFSKCLHKQLSLSKQEALIKGVGTGMFQTVTCCCWALIIWIGAVAVTRKQSTAGEVIGAVMSILFGAISLTYAAPDMQTFNQAKAAGSEVFKVIHRKPIISYDSKGKKSDRMDGNIEIHNIHFAYPSRQEKMILQGFSLSIPAGKTVALVGSSGCGKSTIISLVERFYDPFKGVILIDNHNIKDLDLRFLRKNIGVVSQEPSLFSGTIKDNIRVGNMDADDEAIKNAATMANAHNFIEQLPDKYQAQVGQKGFQLSGGQKQRIAIARAILKNPPILLLDEATSALDTESERLVQDAIEKAMNQRTAIMIAHRMSTIVNADMIAVVQNGQVTETGTHSSLLETNKFYAELFSIQNLNSVHKSSSNYGATEEHASAEKQTSPFEIEEHQQSEEFSKHFTDTYEEEKHKNSTAGTIFFRLWFELRKPDFVKISVGSFAAAFSGISKPLFGYYIITIGIAYTKPHAMQKVGVFSLIFSLVGLLSLFSHTVQHYFFGVVGEKAMRNLRQALYSGMLRNELAWFEKPENNVGSLTSRVINDTSTVKTIISDQMSVIVQCICSILIATVVSIKVDWRMGLVAWAVMPCHFIGGLIQAKSAKGFSGDSAATHHEIVTLASESAANIRTVASFCHEEHILKKAKKAMELPMKNSRLESIKFGIINGISLLMWNIAHAVALWYTTVLVERKQSTFEDGIRSYQIFSLTVPSITEMWTLIPTVVSAISVLTPAFVTLDRRTEIEPDKQEESRIEPIKGKIEFQNVKFKYPSRPEVTVLENFSLLIEPGSKVALVGPSGAGKSSVLAIILRYYDPIRGKVLIDETDIKEYNLRNLRKQIGLVQQEPLLFSSSIRDNICYGTDSATESEIVAVSKVANIHEFISSLPDGYDTVVGERGCQLSGGQKQRIAIARTLLKRPAILLLDEATSALDSESERCIVKALEAIGEGWQLARPTQVTVAHRLSTVVNSDMIVVMDKGEIVEMGSHSGLLSSPEGLYSKMLQHQSVAEY